MNSTMNPSSARSADTSFRINWGAIAAGSTIGLGLLIMLYALGLGSGLSAVDADVEGRLRAVGVFTGMWGLLMPVLALYTGGWVASAGAGCSTKVQGFLQGFVMWGVVAIALLWVTASVIGQTLGGAMSITRQVAQVGGSALASGFDNAGALAQIGTDKLDAGLGKLDGSGALKPITDKFKAAGTPLPTAEDLQRATQQVWNQAIQKGELDRQTVLSAIVQNTSLSAQDAEAVAAEMEKQFATIKHDLTQSSGEAGRKLDDFKKQGADKLQEFAGAATAGAAKAFWGLFTALAVGLIAAALGGTMGVSSHNGR